MFLEADIVLFTVRHLALLEKRTAVDGVYNRPLISVAYLGQVERGSRSLYRGPCPLSQQSTSDLTGYSIFSDQTLGPSYWSPQANLK